MGAEWFTTLAEGTDVHAAFTEAVEAARHEHGHGGGSGTIAEKKQYTIIQTDPVDLDTAGDLAERLMDDNDPRVADKWGPAGAIPVKTRYAEHVQITVPRGVYGTDAEAIRAALGAHDFGGGRPVHPPRMLRNVPRDYLTEGNYGSASYAPRRGGNRFRVGDGASIEVSVEYPVPVHTGWLFFGCAST